MSSKILATVVTVAILGTAGPVVMILTVVILVNLAKVFINVLSMTFCVLLNKQYCESLYISRSYSCGPVSK